MLWKFRTNNTQNTPSFKAVPIGLAREAIQETYRQILSSGDETAIQKAKIDLIQISNIGKHYNGFDKPLLITANKLKNGGYEFIAENNNKETLIWTNAINTKDRASNVLNQLAGHLKHSLLGRLAIRKDSYIEAARQMNFLFGKDEK